MKIIYTDGSTLEVSHIEVYEKHLYCDDCYTVNIEDIKCIEENDYE